MTKHRPSAAELEHLRNTVGRVSDAVDSILDGRAVVIADDTDGVGYLAFAGSLASESLVAWAVRYGSGFLCAAMLPDRARALGLPLIASTGPGIDRHYAVSVDAIEGTSTGISAQDRARTLALLAHQHAHPDAFTRPGHLVVELVAPGGVLDRPRPGECLLDLLSIAELPPVGGLCALVSERDSTALATGDELREFCDTHDTALICVGDMVTFRELTERRVVRVHAEIEWLPSRSYSTGSCVPRTVRRASRPTSSVPGSAV
ncbi:3,4-dihydroxy-2-butanone-4-phosphate synthase [Nocardia jiangxiensis]|uniref:3,4-dihydroxy-2-butanone-4-phosphate synthase n=1 Tax=Nocardia jiangxiensis TaxID=282685 RepID=A0ABW6RU87_9NOCA|nr:3,4-dihydroxy-2-butanone-4-phosphate synthase [Nocardia jiangxiensis]